MLKADLGFGQAVDRRFDPFFRQGDGEAALDHLVARVREAEPELGEGQRAVDHGAGVERDQPAPGDPDERVEVDLPQPGAAGQGEGAEGGEAGKMRMLVDIISQK